MLIDMAKLALVMTLASPQMKTVSSMLPGVFLSNQKDRNWRISMCRGYQTSPENCEQISVMETVQSQLLGEEN
jgi:hypothetical protein